MVQRYLCRSPASRSVDPFIQYLTNGSNEFIVNGESHSASRNEKSRRSTSKTSPKNAERKSTSKSAHWRKRNEQNRFQCDKCPYSTLHRDLGRHMKRHEDVRFPCDICNMPFMLRAYLNSHKEAVHGIQRKNARKIHKCPECDYTTRHDSDISRHRRRHRNAVDSCIYCFRPFYNVGNLVTHMKREHRHAERKVKVDDSKFRNQKLSGCCKENRERYMTDIKQQDEDKHITLNDKESITDISYQRAKMRKTNNKCLVTVVDDTYSKSDYKDDMNEDELYEDKLQDEFENTEDELSNDTVENEVENKDIYCALEQEVYIYCNSDNNESDHYIDNTTSENRSKEQREEIDEEGIMKTIHTENNADGYNETATSTEKDSKDSDRYLRNLMNCAFCEFSARNLKELQKHLDDHDNDIDIPECTDDDNLPENSDTSLIDNTSLSETSIIMDNENNMFLCMQSIGTGSNTTDEETSLLKTTDSADKVLRIVDDAKSICGSKSSTDSHSVQYPEKSTDVLNIFSVCASKIENDDEFKKRPFACSKCFFKTGNLEHLKIHVEAHLYDNIRTAHRVKRRNLSHGTVIQHQGNNNLNDATIQQKDLRYAESDENCLIGRLSKKDFKKHRKCYTEHSTDEETTFKCLICEIGHFKSKESIKEHFLERHKKLREKICETCSHCSKPFP
ncbi:uncharacterized protein LOC123554352 isoform X1 [Mercenaria mercenaria]|uniref:uncharacterized protein LOC123554352 isoform X1 n=1 Tax=Mercenaria mercenaria TaxID=6596 RepID=UPI00234FAF2E|nr:uncharacterized protein LOC123554352 isoform X1 [Mercenaria mercenaria]